MEEVLAKVREQIKPLEACLPEAYPDAAREYFAYYGLEFKQPELEHIFGSFESNEMTLAAHIYRPEKYTATVIIFHGYFSHCGLLSRLIEFLLGAGFAVAAFDMPGHGLSSGPRGSIDSFSQYSSILRDFTDTAGGWLPGPYDLVTHSTGGAAVLNYLLSGEDDVFGKVILAAPLVRTVAWKASKTSYQFYSRYGEMAPRRFRKNSSDAEFLKFVRTADPLQSRVIPLKWVKALHDWDDKIVNLVASCDRQVFIIQGTKDTTVSWRYNIRFIRSKFTDVKVRMIEGARHELFNETPELREEVFSQISNYLEQK